MLDRLYKQFDDCAREHDIFKVETIGDAYMAVANLVKPQPEHATHIGDFALEVGAALVMTRLGLWLQWRCSAFTSSAFTYSYHHWQVHIWCVWL